MRSCARSTRSRPRSRTTKSPFSSTSLRRSSPGWSATSRAPTAGPRKRCRPRSPPSSCGLGRARARRHRSALPLLLRRRRPPPCGRADRHGRHGGLCQPPGGTAQAADRADPHAGAARPLRRRLLRAAAPVEARTRRRGCASDWCTTPTGSKARRSASKRRANSCAISASPPNAASAGAIPRPSRSCCASTPRRRSSVMLARHRDCTGDCPARQDTHVRVRANRCGTMK